MASAVQAGRAVAPVRKRTWVNSPGLKLTPVQIAALYAKQPNIAAIARQLKVSCSLVWRRLQAAGVKCSRPGPPTPKLAFLGDFTLGEVAAGSGVSTQLLSLFCSGKRRPSLQAALRISAFVGKPLDAVVGELATVYDKRQRTGWRRRDAAGREPRGGHMDKSARKREYRYLDTRPAQCQRQAESVGSPTA